MVIMDEPDGASAALAALALHPANKAAAAKKQNLLLLMVLVFLIVALFIARWFPSSPPA